MNTDYPAFSYKTEIVTIDGDIHLRNLLLAMDGLTEKEINNLKATYQGKRFLEAHIYFDCGGSPERCSFMSPIVESIDLATVREMNKLVGTVIEERVDAIYGSTRTTSGPTANALAVAYEADTCARNAKRPE